MTLELWLLSGLCLQMALELDTGSVGYGKSLEAEKMKLYGLANKIRQDAAPGGCYLLRLSVTRALSATKVCPIGQRICADESRPRGSWLLTP